MSEKTTNTSLLSESDLEYTFPIILLLRIILTPLILLIDLIKIPISLLNITCLGLISLSTIYFFLNQEFAGFLSLIIGFLIVILIESFENKEKEDSKMGYKYINGVTSLFSVLSIPLLTIGILDSESSYFPWLTIMAFVGSIIYQNNISMLDARVNIKTSSMSWIQKVMFSQLHPYKELRNRNNLGFLIFVIQNNICSLKGIFFTGILIMFMFSQNITLVLMTITVFGQIISGILFTIGSLFFRRVSSNEDFS